MVFLYYDVSKVCSAQKIQGVILKKCSAEANKQLQHQLFFFHGKKFVYIVTFLHPLNNLKMVKLIIVGDF